MKKWISSMLVITMLISGSSVMSYADENTSETTDIVQFEMDNENHTDKSDIIEFEKNLDDSELEDVEYFVEDDWELKKVSREYALHTKLPSVAASVKATIYEISGDYASVGVSVTATAPIKRYGGTAIMYDLGAVHEYERSRTTITLHNSSGSTFLGDEYTMYVGNANSVRIKLTDGTFEDLNGRTGSMHSFKSGSFHR